MRRISLQEELDAVKANLLEEGELVLRSLRGAVNALGAADVELADEVIAFDDEIDRRYLAIQQGIESLLARQTLSTPSSTPTSTAPRPSSSSTS
jgi:phosphate uptake regulator